MDAQRLLRRMVDSGDYAADEESLLAYSYDASGVEGQPIVVLKPRDEEQVRRILVHANQYRLVIVPRGSGTGVRGGCVKEGGVILDLRGFDRIERLDTQRHTVDVGAGVTIARLNAALAAKGYRFPLIPENGEATLGGLASQNHITEESFLFGDYHDLVERVTCFDGLGRLLTLKGEDISTVIGMEGTTGIILSLRLKLIPEHKITLELVPAKDAETALATLDATAKKGVLMVEYLGKKAAQLLKTKGPCVLVAYANETGSYKERGYVDALLARRKALERTFWAASKTVEEATLTREQVAAFLNLCAKRGWDAFGHLGGGVLMAALPQSERRDFWNGVLALGALPSGKHGFGRTKHEYVPAEAKKTLLKVKEERDYNGILNPGVLV